MNFIHHVKLNEHAMKIDFKHNSSSITLMDIDSPNNPLTKEQIICVLNSILIKTFKTDVPLHIIYKLIIDTPIFTFIDTCYYVICLQYSSQFREHTFLFGNEKWFCEMVDGYNSGFGFYDEQKTMLRGFLYTYAKFNTISSDIIRSELVEKFQDDKIVSFDLFEYKNDLKIIDIVIEIINLM